MKKSKKKQRQNPVQDPIPLSSGTQNNDESTNRKENVIIGLLKKILNIKVLSLIVAVIAAAAAVLAIWEPKEEKLKKKITLIPQHLDLN